MKSILISSPGRCGMHWVADVLGDLLPLKKVKTRRRQDFRFLAQGAIMLTHDPITYFPFAAKEFKTIVVVRDPRDVVVSAAYYWMAKPPADRDTLQRFWGMDEVPGDMNFDKILDILKLRGHNPLWWQAYLTTELPHFCIRYEDMWDHPRWTVSKALSFLAKEATEERIEQALRKQYKRRFLDKGRRLGQEDVNDHYRKGIIGDWENYFTEEENRAFCQRWSDVMEVLGYAVCDGMPFVW